MRLIILLALLDCSAYAATRTAASCSAADIQTEIDAAASGDTIAVPSGSCTWTSGISISGKSVAVAGAGSGRIIAYSLSALIIGTGTKTLTAIPDNVAGSAPSITAGQTLLISELGFRANSMQGTVNSYDSATGALSLNITSSGGTCGALGPPGTMDSNCGRWLISTIPSTVILNNVATVALGIMESTAGNINISGIKFAAGTGAGQHVYITRASGGKPVLIHDCWMEQKETAGSGDNNSHSIETNGNRGVIWNVSFDASPFTLQFSAVQIKDANGAAMPTSWTTLSTMGMADSAATAFCSTCGAGENNLYVENCDFHAYGNLTNIDDNGRAVFRYNFLNNATLGTHGADTSNFGQRHFEFYNNVGVFQGYNSPYATCGCTYTANISAWLWVRGGTFLSHDNILPQITSTDYGTRPDFLYAVINLSRDGGPHACWGMTGTNGQYHPAPRQVGLGRVSGSGTAEAPQVGCVGTGCLSSTSFSGSTDAYTYVGDSEPAYIWNNKRPGGSFAAWTVGAAFETGDSACSPWDSQENYVQADRDYVNTASTPKAGYSPYSYPHQLQIGELRGSVIAGPAVRGGPGAYR